MNVEILARPANAAAKVILAAGEICTAEGGAMIAMSGDMKVDTRVDKKGGGVRGVLKGLARTLGGEGLFLNHFAAGPSGGEVFLASVLPGDMEVVDVRPGVTLNVQNSSFVAHESGVSMEISWQGLKNVFSGENMIWLKMTGPGKVVINAFGAIYPVEVDGEYIVDTGNIAAFEDTLEYKLSRVGKSIVSSFAGGEGIACRFRGKGTIWCQTHADKVFGRKLTPHLAPKKQ